MPSRPDTTVVIRTHGLLLRADVSGEGEPRVMPWRKDWPDPASAVAYALREGGRTGRRVWVLDSDVWLGVVELPASAVAGLPDKDLIDPAAFEAEAFSGLSPVEAVTMVQRRRMLDQDDQFLVTQAKHTDVLAVAKAVHSAGARLAGIGHPAGLPELLEPDGQANSTKNGSWRRVEFWSDSVVLAESVAGRVGLIPLGIGPQSDWRKSLAPHLSRSEQTGQDQTLIGPGVRVRGGAGWRESAAAGGTARWLAAGEDGGDDDDPVPVWDLGTEASAESFAAAWARRLVTIEPSGDGMTPTLRPPKAPAARWHAALVGVIAFAAVMAAVVYQRDQDAQRLTDLKAQLEHAQADQKKVVNQRKQVNQAKIDVRNKQQAIENLERQLEQLGRQRTATEPVNVDRRAALATMMAALTRSAAESVVIQSIEHGSPQHQVSGVALTPEAASRLARDLSEQLRGHWAVSPARIEPQVGPERLIWRFTIPIEPAAGREARP